MDDVFGEDSNSVMNVEVPGQFAKLKGGPLSKKGIEDSCFSLPIAKLIPNDFFSSRFCRGKEN